MESKNKRDFYGIKFVHNLLRAWGFSIWIFLFLLHIVLVQVTVWQRYLVRWSEFDYSVHLGPHILAY